jgi:formylglycine-generating enzyme required for sulfatase activity
MDWEGPLHAVRIRWPFAVGKFEITFAEWDACTLDSGCSYRAPDNGWGRGTRPAINVSWVDVTSQYLPWLSKKTGKTYRLLTETEWEYAARGNTLASAARTIYSFGNDADNLCAYANVADLYARQAFKDELGVVNCADGYPYTSPVGHFRPNAFGLHDMHGNAREWVQDCWNENYNDAPKNELAREIGECRKRVSRGGSWGDNAEAHRTADRGFALSTFRSEYVGFRVARSLP